MIAKIHSGALAGIEALPIEVEADVALGLPCFQLVGMGDRAVAESRHRVRAAVRHAGFELPPRKVTINLAPADVPKDGSAFDLPIAIALLVAAERVQPEVAARFLLAGELALDGSLRPVPGALSLVAAARARGLPSVILPAESAAEASVIPGIEVFGARTLAEVVEHLVGSTLLAPATTPRAQPESADELDLLDVRGQPQARFALEVAAAGGHNLLLVGPPGTGKTMLARRLCSILPPLTRDEALEVTLVYSAAGRLGGRGLLMRPPFRAPHHTVSDAGLIGGARPPTPGEVALAHRGVLFLDELPEFKRHVLECLREPLEDGSVRIRRAGLSIHWPARFQLVATMNPCPCGHHSSQRASACLCTPEVVARYRARISGPLLDRIDLHVEAPRPDAEALRGPPEESSATVRARVLEARERMRRRLGVLPGVTTNAGIPPGALRRLCAPTSEALEQLSQITQQRAASVRSFDRLLRVARTLADLADRPQIELVDVVRATGLRLLDREPD